MIPLLISVSVCASCCPCSASSLVVVSLSRLTLSPSAGFMCSSRSNDWIIMSLFEPSLKVFEFMVGWTNKASKFHPPCRKTTTKNYSTHNKPSADVMQRYSLWGFSGDTPPSFVPLCIWAFLTIPVTCSLMSLIPHTKLVIFNKMWNKSFTRLNLIYSGVVCHYVDSEQSYSPTEWKQRCNS